MAQTVRDSAGIRIVMNEKPSWSTAQQLKLAATPSLIIGDKDEEPYQLTRVRGAFYLSNGKIVVGEAAANELRVYDANGKYLKKFGRVGDGPGEFRDFARAVRLAGDTIAVMHGRSSLSRFTGDGKFLHVSSDVSAGSQSGPPEFFKSVAVPLDGGARLVISNPTRSVPGAVGARVDAKGPHNLIGADDKVIRSLGELPFMEGKVGKDHTEKPWLGAEVVFASNGSEFYYGYPTRYSITRHSARGVPNLIVRRAWTPIEITRKDIETFTEEWLKRWSKKGGAETEKDRRELLTDDYAKTLPAFSAMVLDNTGKLWVRAPKAIDGAVAGSLNNYSIGVSTWSVFGADGRWLGDVSMPALFEPTDIGADFVLGVLRD
ncbi:MAG: hypothetical protein ABI852_16035, partial [Gemmatimonadaceae bacterium]